MGIDLEKAFGRTWTIFKQVLAQTVIQQGSEIPAVQEAVEKQKVVAGKNILWQYFPLMFIGLVTVFAISRFK